MIKVARAFFIFLVLLLAALQQTTLIFAHGFGPPILWINGVVANNNPIFSASTTAIALGQDSAPDNYVVGTSINFELNRANLPAPKEVIDRSIFNWDFADGGKATGLKVSHTYKKSQTYIARISVSDPTENTTNELDTVQINILPYKGYQPPVAKIKINGKLVSDPLEDTFKVQRGDSLVFDASYSVGDGLSYQWDFGDSISQDGKTLTHIYQGDFYPSFPLLRVKDKNGIVADTFAEFFDKTGAEGFFPNPAYKAPSPTSQESKQSTNSAKKSSLPTLPLSLGIIGSTLLVVFLFAARKPKSKKS